MMKISQAGLDLIKLNEGFVGKIYLDQAGKPTIGYGHLIRIAERGKFAAGITRKRAEEILRVDVADAEKAVNELIKVALTQGQFDALVDFTFQFGRAALAASTLRRKLNAGFYALVPDELRKWVNVKNPDTGKYEKNDGIAKRRERDIEMWNRK